jgi:anti-sigma-K factor RskA
MNDPLSVLIVVVLAIGLALLLVSWRRRRPENPEAAINVAAREAERDREKTEALDAKDRARREPPGGSL